MQRNKIYKLVPVCDYLPLSPFIELSAHDSYTSFCSLKWCFIGNLFKVFDGQKRRANPWISRH